MKIVTTTAATIAALSILSACTPSGSSKSSVDGTAQKPEAQAVTSITGSYQGVSAVCEGGTVATKDEESAKKTKLVFNDDGTFKSETTIEGAPMGTPLETSGKYTVSGDTVTIVKESQSYEGQVGFMNEESKVKFTKTPEALTLNVGPSDDGACPENESLIIKYQPIP